MRPRHIVAILLFAFGTSFLVKRAQVMIPVIMENPTPGLTHFGLTIYYMILFLMLSLIALAIGLDPQGPDDFEGKP